MHGANVDVLVIGGGPAGLMAAITAAREGAQVLLLEKNETPGKKLLLTGHGRCNITNMQAVELLREKYFEQAKFLYSEYKAFGPQAVRDFFAELGVPTHEEEAGRIFPDTQKSKTVLDALLKELERCKVDVRCGQPVCALYPEKELWKVVTEGESFLASSVILTCGGAAFPQTGSTGDGYLLATKLGHSIQPIIPALAPILCRASSDNDESDMSIWTKLAGVTIPDVSLSLYHEGKKTAQCTGDLLFTHQGFSGPAAMRLSREMPSPEDTSAFTDGNVQVKLDFVPKWREEEAQARLIEAMQEAPNRPMRKILRETFQLPESVVTCLMGEACKDAPCHEITKIQRQTILRQIKELTCTVDRPASWETAYVTRGGVTLKEIDPKTMQSKRAAGLFFAGEIMDVDGDSGGYNLQHAWASGYVAGHSFSTHNTMPQSTMDAHNTL